MVRWITYLIGMLVFSLGITITITVQHLGLHPWDVLNVAFYNKFGLTIGTFINAILIGMFVDMYMWLGFLPEATYRWTDGVTIAIGIIIMGFGGGLYNAAGVGSGPRDGFMLSISEKLGASIGKVRIITETIVLVLGLLLRGPVHIITFLFTFIQSPIFEFAYTRFRKIIVRIEAKYDKQKTAS